MGRDSSTMLGILAGTAIGATLGILFAPDKGSKTRQRIADEANHAKDVISENAVHIKDSVMNGYVTKKQTLDEKMEHIVSDASYKAEDVITTLESKLKDLKAKNKKYQKPFQTETPVV